MKITYQTQIWLKDTRFVVSHICILRPSHIVRIKVMMFLLLFFLQHAAEDSSHKKNIPNPNMAEGHKVCCVAYICKLHPSHIIQSVYGSIKTCRMFHETQ